MTDQPLAVVTSHESLREAFRVAKLLRNLSNAFCDDAGEFASGHTDKVLGPTGSRGIGPLTFDEFCKMFGVKFVMLRDPEGEAAMQGVWEGREKRNVRDNTKRLSKELLDRAKPILARENGKKGGLARLLKIPREERQRIARKAIITRWRKQRKAARELQKPKAAPQNECRSPIHPCP